MIIGVEGGPKIKDCAVPRISWQEEVSAYSQEGSLCGIKGTEAGLDFFLEIVIAEMYDELI